MEQNKPRWVVKAETFLGVREVPGPKTNPIIAGWLKMLKAWYNDDEAAWCGTFCGAVFHLCGFKIPAIYMRAKDWLAWGVKIPVCVGAVGVKSRKGGGHVTIIVGRTHTGLLVGLGGNQDNQVKYAKFDPRDFIEFRYPPGEPLPLVVGVSSLPLMEVHQNAQSTEA